MLSTTLLFLSGQDTIVILIVALVLFGGKKLPELARGLGQGIREFKDASEGVKKDIQDQINKETEKRDALAQNNTLIADPQSPVTYILESPADHTLIPDHSMPIADTINPNHITPVTDHPRETPLP